MMLPASREFERQRLFSTSSPITVAWQAGRAGGVSHYYNHQLIRRKLVTFNLLKSPTKQQTKKKPVSLQLKSSGFDTILK